MPLLPLFLLRGLPGYLLSLGTGKAPQAQGTCALGPALQASSLYPCVRGAPPSSPDVFRLSARTMKTSNWVKNAAQAARAGTVLGMLGTEVAYASRKRKDTDRV